MQSDLYDKVLDLVSKREPGVTLRDLSNETGIGFHWLCSFAAGRIPNPGVRTIETLYRHLSKEALKL